MSFSLCSVVYHRFPPPKAAFVSSSALTSSFFFGFPPVPIFFLLRTPPKSAFFIIFLLPPPIPHFFTMLHLFVVALTRFPRFDRSPGRLFQFLWLSSPVGLLSPGTFEKEKLWKTEKNIVAQWEGRSTGEKVRDTQKGSLGTIFFCFRLFVFFWCSGLPKAAFHAHLFLLFPYVLLVSRLLFGQFHASLDSSQGCPFYVSPSSS